MDRLLTDPLDGDWFRVLVAATRLGTARGGAAGGNERHERGRREGTCRQRWKECTHKDQKMKAGAVAVYAGQAPGERVIDCLCRGVLTGGGDAIGAHW